MTKTSAIPMLVVPILLLLALFLFPTGMQRGILAAQSTVLDTVEDHISEGRFPEAREGLERWWAGESDASREARQQALWLRARLTVDPSLAELDYRRLVVEYPGGPWSDAALLRLAQGAEFRGDEATAAQYLEILVRDYPTSPHRVEARDRMVRMGTPRPTMGEGTERPSRVLSGPQEDAAPPAPYTVQLGAFSSTDGAEAAADRARSAGLNVRVTQVEGSPLFRVRMGGYPSRSEAERAAELPRQLGFEAIVGSDGEREVSRD